MGFVIALERWPMSAAISLATKGLNTRNALEMRGGGFDAVDLEIGIRLDGAKVLRAVDAMHEHLTDWSYFAYASPGWSNHGNRVRLVDSIAADWVFDNLAKGVLIQKRTYDKMASLIPYIASGLAIELSSGAKTEVKSGEVRYVSNLSRSTFIALLVEFECKVKSVFSESYKKKRKRYYQNNWKRWQAHIEMIRGIVVRYDNAAQKSFEKHLNKK